MYKSSNINLILCYFLFFKVFSVCICAIISSKKSCSNIIVPPGGSNYYYSYTHLVLMNFIETYWRHKIDKLLKTPDMI